jgi:ubiquinone/menaquinone biosynthesis C-methylase UbiE
MLEELIRREFNRWAVQGRGRGIQKTHWEVTRQLIDLMKVEDHDNVLDLGCGTGTASRVLAQKASRGLVLGVDLSDRMIAEARRGYRNPHNALFVVADADYLPCAKSYFHALLSIEAMYYWPKPDAALAEVVRVLRPGGRAVFLVSYYKENSYGHDWAKHIDIPVRLLGAAEYVDVLSKAGFQNINQRRLIDSNPIGEDWKPNRWFSSKDQQAKFQAEGALLLTAER